MYDDLAAARFLLERRSCAPKISKQAVDEYEGSGLLTLVGHLWVLESYRSTYSIISAVNAQRLIREVLVSC